MDSKKKNVWPKREPKKAAQSNQLMHEIASLELSTARFPPQTRKARKNLRERAEQLAKEKKRDELREAAVKELGDRINDKWIVEEEEIEPTAPFTVQGSGVGGWDPLPVRQKSEEELAEERDNLAKEKIAANLKGWPYNGPTLSKKLATIGPYTLNPCYRFKHRPDQQLGSTLIILMQKNNIVSDIVLKLIFRSRSSATNFAATCQLASQQVLTIVNMWDMTAGWFNNCQYSRLAPQPEVTEDGKYVPPRTGSVAPVVVVTPLKQLETKAISYAEQLEHLYTMCVSVNNWCEFVQNIQFHRVPFLTTEVLALLVPKMRNLEALGVYKCQLIHVGKGMELLRIIQADRLRGKENSVHLDWYPNIHKGPDPDKLPKHLRDNYTGAYGATWDNWKGDTNLAIWGLANKFIKQASRQNIDTYSRHTMFYKFLVDSSCWDVDRTLKKLRKVLQFDRITSSNPGIIPIPAVTHYSNGMPINPNDYGGPAAAFPDTYEAIALMDSRNVNHRGNFERFIKKNTDFRPEGYKWTGQAFPCMGCNGEARLGIFFDYPEVRQFLLDLRPNTAPPPIHCLGCKLTTYLDSEHDHYKKRKRDIMRYWISNDDRTTNDNNLPKFIDDFASRNVLSRGEVLDSTHKNHLEVYRYNRETSEVQREMSAKVKRANRGDFTASPKVGEWQAELALRKQAERDPEGAKWSSYRADRYQGHCKYNA